MMSSIQTKMVGQQANVRVMHQMPIGLLMMEDINYL